MTIQKNLV